MSAGKIKNKNTVKTKKMKVINKKKVVFITMILSLLVLFGNKVWDLILRPTDIVVIEKGTIERMDTVVGYVIRKEKVLKGDNYKNGIVQIKGEGEKVAKGDSVFRYYTNNEDEILNEIQELDIEYKKALDGQDTIFSSDIKMLDKEINKLIEEISGTNNLSEIAEYKKQLNNAISKKTKIVGETSPKGSYIKKLLEQKTKYEQKIDLEAEYVKAKESGIVSYKVDGYEDYFDINEFSAITEEKMEKIDMKTGQLVATNSECAKLVENFECYIAVTIDSKEAQNAKNGQIVKLRLSNTQEISAEIVYIADGEKDNEIIVFKLNSGVEYLISYRKVSIDVIWWSEEGLKVPKDSIIDEGNISYVIRNRAGYTDKIPVKILKDNGKFSLVDNYDAEELKKIGYTTKEIELIPRVNLYDEILINKGK